MRMELTFNERRQKLYDLLIELGTPESVRESGIFGAILDAFTQGYNGQPPYRGYLGSYLVITAYKAGNAARAKKDRDEKAN
jgi:hypothetical protein